jgi:2-polyprenyl-3-methyl-5-hydroxy-6-metoxy-1,4-benzoquinol methylase
MKLIGRIKNVVKSIINRGRDVDALYKILYDEVHDLECSREIRPSATMEAFDRQWTDLPNGEYLLSDPWFRENVDRILVEQELLLKREWFEGKSVLDAGCGNGRWSFGFSKLGANITCMDINKSAIKATRAAINSFQNRQIYIQTPLENMDKHISKEGYDLVFCWGVAHHCVRFNQVLSHLTSAVKPRGILYLYLYGRESLSIQKDLRLFRDRVAYNVLMNDRERNIFLLKKAGKNPNKMHMFHDIYAPLINRRFSFLEIQRMLANHGFTECLRTIDHTELFIRSTRKSVDLSGISIPPHAPPYWFQGKHL